MRIDSGVRQLGQTKSDQWVEEVRAFNRFYTEKIGVLQEDYLGSPFSLSEVRVLYELAHREESTAAELAQQLGLDPGYLSRILRRFSDRGLVERERAPNDARRSILRLTEQGREAFAPLDAGARESILLLLRDLSADDSERLVRAMKTIESALGARAEPTAPYVLRPPRSGDYGWVVQAHGALYAREYGWDEGFEGLVAQIVAKFIREYDHRRERCWIAEREGENVGCVLLVKQSDDIAKLRLLLVEPSARGLGIGRRLVDECVCHARSSGYRTLTLWTNDVLIAARNIYEAAGFHLVDEERHHSFGHDLVGQNWVLEL